MSAPAAQTPDEIRQARSEAYRNVRLALADYHIRGETGAMEPATRDNDADRVWKHCLARDRSVMLREARAVFGDNAKEEWMVLMAVTPSGDLIVYAFDSQEKGWIFQMHAHRSALEDIDLLQLTDAQVEFMLWMNAWHTDAPSYYAGLLEGVNTPEDYVQYLKVKVSTFKVKSVGE